MAMITAFEFDDFLAPGKSPRKPNSRHGRLGTRTGHANTIHARQNVTDIFRQFDLPIPTLEIDGVASHIDREANLLFQELQMGIVLAEQHPYQLIVRES